MKDELLDAAYLAGFNASGEGYNGEYGIDCPEENAIWKKDRDNALTAIKQARSAPEQEPVVRWDSDGWGDLLVDNLPDGTLLYTTPPAQSAMPLLFSQRKAIADKLCVQMDTKFNAVVREVEAALGITKKGQP